jgi:hypothetical protein
MTTRSDDHAPWQPGQAGSDQVLERASGSERMLFALGPARAGEPPERRLADVVADRAPEVRSAWWGRQVHGRAIASVDHPTQTPSPAVICAGSCDGLITDSPGVAVTVWTADCAPLLIAGGGVVAAVHAGWRGAAADIVGAVVCRFWSEFGVRAGEITAALGPAVSGPCYPVGDEVITALQRLDVEETRWRDGRHVDLRALLRGRLRSLGVATVDVVGGCTASSPDLASYRRDGGHAGRQWSMVYRPVVG